MLGFNLALAAGLYAGGASVEAILNVCVILAAIMVMVAAAQAISQREEVEAEEYKSQLKTYSSCDLKKLTTSSELNDKEKELVKQFLNEHYQGWSIQN